MASNLANLNHSTEVMQRRTSTRVDYIPAIAILQCIAYSIITRRGLTCVAYPWNGAMLRPEAKDGREVRFSHAFFVPMHMSMVGAKAFAADTLTEGIHFQQ